MEAILEARNIVKEFPGVIALKGVSFSLEAKQIHALCGENGAGKSTLINVLSGVFPPSSYTGDILMDGQKVHFNTISEAENAGIAVIHQELNLFDKMTLTENLFLGHEVHKHGILDWDDMYSQAGEWISKLKIDGALPNSIVSNFGVGQQQLIKIACVLRLLNIKVLILDEPTASLTQKETKILMDILRGLRNEGTACIYISHNIDEVMEIADYVTILRDGENVGSGDIHSLTKKDIIRTMVGREITELYPNNKSVNIEECVLEIKDFNVSERVTNKEIINRASFKLFRGEILGLAGLIGAGRTELMSAIFGFPSWKTQGEILINGEKRIIKFPQDALQFGLTYVTEERKAYGIIPTMNIRENISITSLDKFKSTFNRIQEDKEITEVSKMIHLLQIKTPNLDTKIVNLSGGNQQKVMLSRSLLCKTRILILDEPTMGIDVGAKQEIYSIMNSLVKNGISIIMISSELPEVLGMCDRILVMYRGKITGEFNNLNRNITQEKVMICATGTEREE